jgi:hypothetical protein
MTTEENRIEDCKNLYNMKCLEDIDMDCLGELCRVIRVPGGWIFDWYKWDENHNDLIISINKVFVPYSDEFKPTT